MCCVCMCIYVFFLFLDCFSLFGLQVEHLPGVFGNSAHSGIILLLALFLWVLIGEKKNCMQSPSSNVKRCINDSNISLRGNVPIMKADTSWFESRRLFLFRILNPNDDFGWVWKSKCCLKISSRIHSSTVTWEAKWKMYLFLSTL